MNRWLALALLSVAGSARAAPPRLDLVRGPVITSSRIMGLGGAFVGVGEGIDGIYRNPAALANRNERSTGFFDIDVTLDWLIVSSADIDWDGDARSLEPGVEFQSFNVGLVMQFGPLGLGVLATTYGWQAPTLAVTNLDVLLGLGWAFDDGAWILGAGSLYGVLGLTTGVGTDAAEDAELNGGAGDFGLLWRPRDHDWRLGLRARTKARLVDPAVATQGGAGEDGRATGVEPWLVALGWSSYHPAERGRRYNPRLRAEVPPPLDRRYLLISAELEVIGPTDGVSIESLVGDGFDEGGARPSGRHVSIALHLGAEGEVLHDRLRARVGTYFEPVRVSGSQDMRPHLTGGLELHLFEVLFDWKANFAFDLAPGWENVTIGVGFWK